MLGFGEILSTPPVSVIESPPVSLQCTSELIRSIVCTLPPFLLGGVTPPTKYSKRGGLTGPQRGVAGKEGGNFFQGRLQFYKKKKKKLKSEIFNDKSL